jgi:hypothetical protein
MGILTSACAQNLDAPNFQVHPLLELSGNGNRYGLQLEYQRPLSPGKGKFTQHWGVFNESFRKSETDIEGMSGYTFSNQLGASLSHHFQWEKTSRWYLANTLYAGWGYRYTQANYQNDRYQINRDYTRTRHYFALGMYWKAGYHLSPKLAVQAIGKTDFSRLIDRYEATIFERPGFMYGLGIQYTW